MSITTHPMFQILKPYFIAQPAGNPNYRIEMKNQMPSEVIAMALRIQIPCVKCGCEMYPFRAREGKGSARGGNAQHIYFSACCPLKPPLELRESWDALASQSDVTVAALKKALKEAASYPRFCNRGGAASKEYIRVVEAVRS